MCTQITVYRKWPSKCMHVYVCIIYTHIIQKVLGRNYTLAPEPWLVLTLFVIVKLKIYINKSVKSLCNTYYLLNFLTDCFQNVCIPLHSNTAESDYYYYTDVTPLKAKNMLLRHETLKFNVNGRHFFFSTHRSTTRTGEDFQPCSGRSSVYSPIIKHKDLVSEKQKLSVNLVKCHNYYSQYYTTDTQFLSVSNYRYSTVKSNVTCANMIHYKSQW